MNIRTLANESDPQPLRFGEAPGAADLNGAAGEAPCAAGDLHARVEKVVAAALAHAAAVDRESRFPRAAFDAARAGPFGSCSAAGTGRRGHRRRRHRGRWMKRAEGFATRLGLSCRLDYASDPFFGRGGAEVRAACAHPLLDREANSLHELQLSSRPLRDRVGRPHHGWRGGAHRLRSLRHRSPGAGAGVAHGLDLARWPDGVRKALTIES
jgi:hypothetical protein